MSRLCDFCSSPATFVHPASSFHVPNIHAESAGDWLACDDCHHLIESGQRDALVSRCVKIFLARHPYLDDEQFVRGHTAGFLAKFFAHRAGASRPLV